jgi:pimeloyl-ACP methyl ester carboxylesterase
MDTRTITTRSGDIAVADTAPGDHGRTALFVHGVGTSSHLWRKVIAELSGERRCVAVDLPAHGASPGRADYSLPAVAAAIEDARDALGLDGVDLVANDTGGAIAQVYAAAHPERLRTLTLTNCDTHDNLPPEAFKPTADLAEQGRFAELAAAAGADPELGRPGIGTGYEHPEAIPLDTLRAYLGTAAGTPERAKEFERFITSLRAEDLLAAEPGLRKLDVPTLVVWGTGDDFFATSWAYWLRDTIPGVTEVVEVPGAKLFFPDERPGDLVPHLRRHWAAH